MARWFGPAILACVGCAPATGTSPAVARSSAPPARAAPAASAEPPARAAASPARAPKPAPAIPWAELEPVRHVHTTTDGKLFVYVRERDPAFRKRHRDADMGHVELARDDKRLPAAVRAIERVWVLTPAGVHEANAPLRASFSISSFGDNWAMAFAWKGDEHQAIALPRPPHASTRLVAPADAPDPRGVLRKAILGAAPKRFRPKQGVTIQLQSAPARLPDGATTVVSGWWHDEEGSDVSYGVVLTVGVDGSVVHRISKHRDYMTWATIQWVGDLDGDGVDEIGWGFGGLEDEAYFLTRFADGKKTELELYAAGE